MVKVHDYPPQEDVSQWVARNLGYETLGITAYELSEEVSELSLAIRKRELGPIGSYEERSTEIEKELGDVMLRLLDVAESAGFDLGRATAARWAEVSVEPSPIVLDAA